MPAGDQITYQFEYAERIRCAFIGAGGHSFRNVYPALQYAPVELVAVCDLDQERAAEYARLFGAARAYTRSPRNVGARTPDRGLHRHLLHTRRAGAGDGHRADCLRAGAQVWTEKPTAASVAEILSLKEDSRARRPVRDDRVEEGFHAGDGKGEGAHRHSGIRPGRVPVGALPAAPARGAGPVRPERDAGVPRPHLPPGGGHQLPDGPGRAVSLRARAGDRVERHQPAVRLRRGREPASGRGRGRRAALWSGSR